MARKSRKEREEYESFTWLSSQNLHALRGKWIVVLDRKVLASDAQLEKAMKKAGPIIEGRTPLVTRIPEDEVIVA